LLALNEVLPARFVLSNELPPLGSASRGLRVLSESWNAARTQLTLEVSGLAGSRYQLDVWNPGQISSVEGATLTKLGKNQVDELISGPLGGMVFSTPAYFNGAVYYGAVDAPLQRFVLSAARLAPSAASRSAIAFRFPGTTPSVSANGASGAIVWAVENGSPAVLHAYDATDLSRELYSSGQNAARDSLGPGNKFITPTVAAGKVLVGTTRSVAVYGLLR